MKWILYNVAWLIVLFVVVVIVLASHWTFGALLVGVVIGMRVVLLGLIIKKRRRHQPIPEDLK